MKKHTTLLSFAFTFACIIAKATIHTVSVADFSFTPSTMNVTVGDTVRWTWVSGSHTTTSSSVPAGAATWNNAINSTSTTFDYKVTMAGTYNYLCSIHPTMMTGNFTATAATGISSVSQNPFSTLNVYVTEKQLNMSMTLHEPAYVNILLHDLLGKNVRALCSGVREPGMNTETYSLNDIPSGIYYLELLSGNRRVTRKFVVE